MSQARLQPYGILCFAVGSSSGRKADSYMMPFIPSCAHVIPSTRHPSNLSSGPRTNYPPKPRSQAHP